MPRLGFGWLPGLPGFAQFPRQLRFNPTFRYLLPLLFNLPLAQFRYYRQRHVVRVVKKLAVQGWNGTMLRNRLFWSLAALLVLSLPGVARAQYFQPFIDPCAFDLDYQWFKPLYCECGEEYSPERNGIYFAYDRARMNVSRPDQSPGNLNGDWTWGNRFDFGYMTEEAGGWACSVWKIDSPNQFIVNTNVNRNGEVIPDLLGDPVGPVQNTINDMELYSFEVNRVWRLAPTHRGAILEPLLGVRFIRLTDYFSQQDYQAIREAAPVNGPANGAIALDQADIYTVDGFKNANDIFGGQFGMRMATARGRWRLSSDLRGLVMNNFQDRQDQQIVELNQATDIAVYDANGVLQAVNTGAVTSSQQTVLFGNDENRFVWGGELRLEATFDVTTVFALRFGMEVLALADGVGRGVTSTDEMFTAAGLTAGFTLNR